MNPGLSPPWLPAKARWYRITINISIYAICWLYFNEKQKSTTHFHHRELKKKTFLTRRKSLNESFGKSPYDYVQVTKPSSGWRIYESCPSGAKKEVERCNYRATCSGWMDGSIKCCRGCSSFPISYQQSTFLFSFFFSHKQDCSLTLTMTTRNEVVILTQTIICDLCV